MEPLKLEIEDFPHFFLKIVDNINEAYNNRTYEFGNTYSVIGSEGIRISMSIDGNGKIISAFPSE